MEPIKKAPVPAGTWKTTKRKSERPAPVHRPHHKKVGFREARAALDPVLKKKWEDIQNKTKKLVVEKDDPDFDYKEIKLVAGFDISLAKEEKYSHLAVASICVMKFPSLELVYEKHIKRSHDIPYCSGFLAFKELPAMKELFSIFQKERPDLKVDFILVDGNGLLHCNACGCASHFGVEINMPTIGCSKNIFAVDGINKFMIKDIKDKWKRTKPPKGVSVPLIGKSGRVWGHALKSGKNTLNPLIVSVGHRVSIETAVRVVNACSNTRVPEPIRFVDLKSRELIKQYVKSVAAEEEAKKEPTKKVEVEEEETV